MAGLSALRNCIALGTRLVKGLRTTGNRSQYAE